MASIRMKIAAGLAACVLACPTAGPTQADEKKEAALKGWGRAVDPDGDCEIASDGATLGVKIPGKSHDFAADIGIRNAPRVLREVKGDFIAEVRVGGELDPGDASTIAGRLPYHGGGLLLVRDDDNYFSLHRGCVFIDEKPRHYANFELRKGGRMAASRYEIEIPNQETYLRLERRGNLVFNATSPDGIHWSSYEPIELELPETVRLGVVGITSSSRPLSLQFRDLRLYRKADPE